jgi:hypothetical protein
MLQMLTSERQKKMDESGTEVMYHDSYAYRHEAIADVILSLLMNTSEA